MSDKQNKQPDQSQRLNPGRFQKGKSGNPKGRPRQKVEQQEGPPVLFPTRELVRKEADRLILVKEGNETREITARQAIIRAQSHSAMRGSVFAQREILKRFDAEDERDHRERKERFDIWKNYKETFQNSIAAARKAGRDEPDCVPHPDDIVLDWGTLDVRFLGAMDDEDRAQEKKTQVLHALWFELSIYSEEDNEPPDRSGKGGRIGLYLALHLLAALCLPPRLRGMTDALMDRIFAAQTGARKAWKAELERRCQEADVPFLQWRRGAQPPTISLDEFEAKRKAAIDARSRRPAKG